MYIILYKFTLVYTKLYTVWTFSFELKKIVLDSKNYYSPDSSGGFLISFGNECFRPLIRTFAAIISGLSGDKDCIVGLTLLLEKLSTDGEYKLSSASFEVFSTLDNLELPELDARLKTGIFSLIIPLICMG